MSRKTTVVFSVLLLFALLAGTWGTAAAQFIDDTHEGQGRQGIFVPAGLNPNFIHAHRVDNREAPWAPAKFSRAVILLEPHFNALNQGTSGASLPDTGGSQGQSQQGQQSQSQQNSGVSSSIPTTMVYVYFTLNGKEARQYQRGELSIWYRPTQGGSWQTCPSFIVNDSVQSSSQSSNNPSSSSQGSNNQDRTRSERQNSMTVACIAPAWNAYFGVGALRSSIQQNNANQGQGQGQNGQALGDNNGGTGGGG